MESNVAMELRMRVSKGADHVKKRRNNNNK